MDKVFAYAGTRNLYEQMFVCLTSLLRTNKPDRVYLLIEDDEYPFKVPSNVIIKNVSNQPYFNPEGPNYKSHWSYMAMLRCAFGNMFPDEHRILWLDSDTIVLRDITELFTMPMNGYVYGGVEEPKKSLGIFHYINSGVLLCNLDLIRKMDVETKLISELNCQKYHFPDQDVINLFNQGHILVLSSHYGLSVCSEPCDNPKILHFCAEKKYRSHWAWVKNEQAAFPERY